jgi:hypothetical protein
VLGERGVKLAEDGFKLTSSQMTCDFIVYLEEDLIDYFIYNPGSSAYHFPNPTGVSLFCDNWWSILGFSAVK